MVDTRLEIRLKKVLAKLYKHYKKAKTQEQQNKIIKACHKISSKLSRSNYKIHNKTNTTQYFKYFRNNEEARHWIINTLDLSLNWEYVRLCDCDEDTVCSSCADYPLLF